jgi:hypothetical protein
VTRAKDGQEEGPSNKHLSSTSLGHSWHSGHGMGRGSAIVIWTGERRRGQKGTHANPHQNPGTGDTNPHPHSDTAYPDVRAGHSYQHARSAHTDTDIIWSALDCGAT